MRDGKKVYLLVTTEVRQYKLDVPGKSCAEAQQLKDWKPTVYNTFLSGSYHQVSFGL